MLQMSWELKDNSRARQCIAKNFASAFKNDDANALGCLNFLADFVGIAFACGFSKWLDL